MIYHYLKSAFRSIRNQKAYSIINIGGLSLGFACCMLVILFVRDDYLFDQFHRNGDRIYRVNMEKKTPSGRMETSAGQPVPLAPALKAELPGVEYTTRLKRGSATVKTAEGNPERESLLFADADFFQMFTFPLVHGNPESVLEDKASIVLTKTAALRTFGSTDVLGKMLSVSFGNEFLEYAVSGVAEDPSDLSSIQFEFVLPYENSPSYRDLATSWTSWGAVTFVQLTPATRPELFEERLAGFLQSHFVDLIRTWRILGWIAKEEGSLELRIQRLSDIHLDPSVQDGLLSVSNPLYGYILSGIGFMVLLIACINFTTLAIGRAASRVQEVGVRKTFGAMRSQLVIQFWVEAFLFSILAFCLGIVFTEALLPLFNTLSHRTLSLGNLGGFDAAAVFLGLTFLVAMLAGGYPAVLLSRFQPAEVIKHSVRWGKNRFSQALVILQFSLSVLLIFSTLVMSRQVYLLRNTNPGFNVDRVVVIPTNARGANGEILMNRFRRSLEGQPGVLGVTGNSDGFNKEPGFRAFGNATGGSWQVNVMRVEAGFIKTFGMEIMQGRDFLRDNASDEQSSVIVNEALVKEFVWDDPVGKTFQNFELSGIHNPTIVGVVKDFNYSSLREHVKPMVLHLDPKEEIRYIFVRVGSRDMKSTLALLQESWSAVAPDKPFSYYFLDEDFARQYQSEERWTQIVQYSSTLAIVIACVGLVGLTTLTISRRTKELGVRKVLGATTFSLIRLVISNFMLLIAIANVLTWPLAYIVMERWLEDFAFRIEMEWWMFLASGVIVVVIALTTMITQALRAARANPVDALRYE